MSSPVTHVCRVCLMSLTNRKYYNLYISPGRTQQISTKIMACAWVQVFDGDGLPNHICCKCHDTLEVAYQFKQLCESSDAQLRQFFGRSLPSKSNSLDLALDSRDCNADLKPINFNMCNDRPDLSQCDLSLNTLRLLNQDASFMSNLQLGLPEQPCDTKEEPGYHAAFNSLIPELRSEQNSAFKTTPCVDGESLFSTFQAKLLEAVSESLSNVMPPELNDNRLVAWDLQCKQPQLHIPEKTITDLNSVINQKVTEDVTRDDSLSFLEETRCILSPSKGNEIDCNGMDNEHRNGPCKVNSLLSTSKTLAESNPVECEKPTTFTKKKSVSNNIERRPSKKIKKREQCELCGKVFHYSGYLQLHMRTHTDERPHECSVCRQTFSMPHALVTHMRTHSGLKPYMCTECGKGFSQSSGLKSHMRCHSGEKPFQCELCPMKFAQSSNLRSHKLTHSGRRDYVCKICSTAFKFLKHLTSHQQTHNTHKQFKCNVCMKSFNRKRYLEKHLSAHRGSRPYRCDTCGQACSSVSNLRTHVRVHSGLKPYCCQICKKSFSQSNTLKRHMKQHRLTSTAHTIAPPPPHSSAVG